MSPHPIRTGGAACAAALRGALGAACFALAAVAGAASTAPPPIPISPVPLPLSPPVAPNLFITIDDSGSTQRAFVPDGLDDDTNDGADPGFKSTALNALYYDPLQTYTPPPDAQGVALTTSFNSAYIDGFNPGVGTPVNLATGYRPTREYDPLSTNQTFAAHSSGLLDPGGNPVGANSGTGAYYYDYVPGGSCPAVPTASTAASCYQVRFVSATSGPGGTDERQNFANWYSFYRTRHLALITAAARAMASPALDRTRVAWQAINSCNDGFDGTDCGGVDNSIGLFSGQKKTDFYAWLQDMDAGGGTPLRSAVERVGEYVSTAPPWREVPTNPSSPEISCRANFHLVLTDGLWNGDGSADLCGSSCGNDDNASRTLPDGVSYSPGGAGSTAVYGDGNSNVLADLTFYYWSRDLRPTLANNVPPYQPDKSTAVFANPYWNPRNDPATWQHIVTYTVGMGLTGSLGGDWAGSTYAGSFYAGRIAGSNAWPAVTANQDTPPKVYDLWHAALNGRGEAFAAETPQGLLDAFQSFLARAQNQSQGATAVAASSTSLRSDTLLFQAGYDPAGWSGSLKAFALTRSGSTYTVAGTPAWNTDTTLTRSATTASGRNLLSWSAGAAAGIDFTQTDLVTANLWSHIGSTAVLGWLRGDLADEEGQSGGTLRPRSVLLGDVVGSNPTFAHAENFGYAVLPSAAGGGATYVSYLASKAARTKAVYVGANDGMLHGFNAATGAELFAYMPAAVVPRVAALSSVNYTHQFYVDGSPFVGDAFLGGAWKTVLIGLTGAGGKAAFALDVSAPASFTKTNVLWELDGASDTDLGYTIGRATIARMNDGNWYAVFGNGINSTRQCPVLYLVRLSASPGNPTVVKLDPSGGAGVTPFCDAASGLGTPALLDLNGDRTIDRIYAGDQRGDLWRFDVSAAGTGSWSSGSTPLFRARTAGGAAQPITFAPEIGQGLGTVPCGVTLYFGTGRYFATGDESDTTTQSLYGVADPTQADGTTCNGVSTTIGVGRADLTQRTYTEGTGAAAGTRTIVDLGGGATISPNGWFIDVASTGERTLGTPALVDTDSGVQVVYSTVSPTEAACTAGGVGYLWSLLASSGGTPGTPVWSSTPGTAPVIRSPYGPVPEVTVLSDNGKPIVLTPGPGGIGAYAAPKTSVSRRLSWREVVR